MIIQCPYCATRFTLAESRLTGAHPMLKCSRCRHIFPGPTLKPATPESSAAPPTTSPAATRAENLSFTFSEPSTKEEPPVDLTIDEPEPEYELGTGPAPEPGAARAEPDHHLEPAKPFSALFEEDDLETIASPLPDDFEPEPVAATEDEVDEPTDEEEEMPRGISLRPVFIFLTLVVLAYGAISWSLRSSPELTDSLFRKVPFISSMTEDRLLNRKIVLNDITGGYQRIKDGQTVFVITGRAINNAPVTVRSIQIMGRLFDGKNSQVDEKTIFCGNVISMKILKSLTQREVSILQDLKPPKRFGIAPGEESTFVIVFMQPPNGVTEFSSQVIAAQRQA